jgi:hypothetical protein
MDDYKNLMMDRTEVENPILGKAILRIFEDFIGPDETTLLLDHLRLLTKMIKNNKYLLIIIQTTMNIVSNKDKVLTVEKEWLLQEILLPMFDKLKDPAQFKKYNNLLMRLFSNFAELGKHAISFSAEIFSKIFEIINVNSDKVRHSPFLSTAGIALNILSQHTSTDSYKEFFLQDEDNVLVFANILRLFWKLKNRIGVYYDTLIDTSLVNIFNCIPDENFASNHY